MTMAVTTETTVQKWTCYPSDRENDNRLRDFFRIDGGRLLLGSEPSRLPFIDFTVHNGQGYCSTWTVRIEPRHLSLDFKRRRFELYATFQRLGNIGDNSKPTYALILYCYPDLEFRIDGLFFWTPVREDQDALVRTWGQPRLPQ